MADGSIGLVSPEPNTGVAHFTDTAVEYTSGKLHSFRNDGAEQSYINFDGDFVGDVVGNITGAAGSATTAGTATTLFTARAINGVDFDGSASITVTAAAGTLSGATLAAGVTASSLTSIGTLATGAVPASLVTAGTFGTGDYIFPGDLVVDGTGPNAFGVAALPYVAFRIGGEFTSDGAADWAAGWRLDGELVTHILDTSFAVGAILSPTIDVRSETTLGHLSTLDLNLPTIQNPHPATIANAETLRVRGAPSGATAVAAIRIDAGSMVCSATVLATNATAGFLYIPSCAGVPSGTPEAHGNALALVFDASNDNLYLYDGAWLKVAMAA